MQLIIALFAQLLVYGIAGWLLFVAVAFCGARFGGWLGIIGGHILVAVIIAYLDIRRIQAVMSAPGWNGVPDMDLVFEIGLLLRIVLVNTLLLPISIFAFRQRFLHHGSRVATHVT